MPTARPNAAPEAIVGRKTPAGTSAHVCQFTSVRGKLPLNLTHSKSHSSEQVLGNASDKEKENGRQGSVIVAESVWIKVGALLEQTGDER